MIANYHTHTVRCRHAKGTEREYVEKAIERGLKILGFSDHSPYIFEGDFYSAHRMFADQLEDYVSTILALKEEYKKEIQIHLGMEIEYYPKYWEKTLQMLRQYPIEYLILGQHFLDNEIGAWYSGDRTEEKSKLIRYCEQTVEAMGTGLFTYFAHPDLIRYEGDPAIYDRHIRKLCREAKRMNVPLEINFLGLHDHRFYPNAPFWKIAGEENCAVILGADAHNADAVCDPGDYEMAMKLVSEFGLHVIDTVELKGI